MFFLPGTSRDPLGILRIGALGILTIPKAPTAPKGAEGAESLILFHPVGPKRPWIRRIPTGPVPSSFFGPETTRRQRRQPAPRAPTSSATLALIGRRRRPKGR
uniref:Uncharacterized protein n=1 Tax=Placozoa sp. H17 HM-2017 TaxID=2017600 RepID=A0A7I6NFH0_9METZ|nr:hypothetical protein [Placozoa sp. H17 HM-2017]